MITVVVDPGTVGVATVESSAPSRRPRLRMGLLIWSLLFFNGLAFMNLPLLIPFPAGVGKLLTQG
ncbi:MAG: hypothetical protein QOH10_2148, partial [Actinomycetota bacterium]|nr:hypothetical protein [Actinomycetota bacterium]